MTCNLSNAKLLLLSLIGMSCSVCAVVASAEEGASLFAAPQVHAPTVSNQVQSGLASEQPLRTAWDCRTETGFQPSVLRFGVIPPPPIPNPVVDCYSCDTFAPPLCNDAEHDAHVLHHPPATDCRSNLSIYYQSDFSGDPIYDHIPWDSCVEMNVYGGKHLVPTQHPLLELGFPFYRNGPVPPYQELFGPTNLVLQKLYVYGDYRVAYAQNNLVGGDHSVLAHRLNLEFDYWLTATERFHMFSGPFQEGNSFMRIDNGDFVEVLDFFDANTDTAFFEGDLGQIIGGFTSSYSAFDMPITAGIIPLLFQNGIWMQDAMVGVAATIPARNNPALDWSNYDVTMFAAFDKVSTGAAPGDEDAAQLFGATTFIESRGGYFELGYAYVNDRKDSDRNYNNLGISYTRRYLNRVSNSMRVIVNAGQNGPQSARTADGVLLLAENTLISRMPYNLMPYCNFFAGFDRPQPAARAAAFGGVLFNTGILFQSDALTGYPTLDATANNTFGVATGVDLLGPNYDQQLIVEVAALQVMGSDVGRAAPGDQLGVGFRYQVPITNAHLLRFDAMHGWLDNSEDINGARAEFRWKF
ncbi:hypothetical protein [Aeoliella sp.]|uniref:hypothetical protein n=1 Tax=Aeoliella sp. TaxID=2795800 RepID=UPI003CCB75DA